MEDRNLIHDIIFDFEINASVSDVWKAWTTERGIRSFFSPDCRVDFKVDGRFEILFDTSAPEGLQGSEGMKILAMERERMFSFTWNAPPDNPAIRSQRTFVNVHLFALSGTRTRLLFRNIGYGQGDEWRRALQYFKNAWGNVVLPRLVYYLENGQYDWENPPDLSDYRLYRAER